jgi:Uma2 family endonuclease
MSSVLDVSGHDASSAAVRLPEHYEVINGEIVEIAPRSDYAREVASRLSRAVSRYLDTNQIGESGVERLFRILLAEDRGRNREPDMFYLSFERWPRDRVYPYTGNARDGVPDIVGEVASPGDTGEDLLKKAREYLRGGVRLVWVVYPLTQEVHAYSPGANQVRVYTVTDELDAGDILPGFHTSVAALFPPTIRPTLPDDEPIR